MSTSDIATIKFSGGVDGESSSDESAEEFSFRRKEDDIYKTSLGKTVCPENPFDINSDTKEYDETKNPFHETKPVDAPSKKTGTVQSKGLNPFEGESDNNSELDKTNPFHEDTAMREDVVQAESSNAYMERNLQSANRFNPFDAEVVNGKDQTDEDLWWESQVTQTNGVEHGSTDSDNLDMSEDHFSPPEGYMSMTSVAELEAAIGRCKQVVLQCMGQSDKQKEMINKLIQLRLKLIEAKEGPQKSDPDIKNVLGHKFMKREGTTTKHYCEKCNTMIWGMLQQWYRCTECGFCVHDKCVNLISRTCASVQVSEHGLYTLSICPERGLSSQNYKCAECRTPISYQAGFGEPRQCDYSGYYYCDLCHWNDQMSIPARIVHNWDFEPRKVCRASKQYLKLMCKKPVLRIQDLNPMLFSFVEELNQVKKLREEILIMKKYFLSCKRALQSKLLLLLVTRQHFVENSDMYSLQDLLDTASDQLMPELTRIHSSFAQHIKTDCQICRGKGFVCELCDYNEILFPFDNHAIVCAKCSTVLHRHCFVRRNQMCPKCERMDKRSIGDESSIEQTA